MYTLEAAFAGVQSYLQRVFYREYYYMFDVHATRLRAVAKKKIRYQSGRGPGGKDDFLTFNKPQWRAIESDMISHHKAARVACKFSDQQAKRAAKIKRGLVDIV